MEPVRTSQLTHCPALSALPPVLPECGLLVELAYRARTACRPLLSYARGTLGTWSEANVSAGDVSSLRCPGFMVLGCHSVRLGRDASRRPGDISWLGRQVRELNVEQGGKCRHFVFAEYGEFGSWRRDSLRYGNTREIEGLKVLIEQAAIKYHVKHLAR
jgi:hypothetical protein